MKTPNTPDASKPANIKFPPNTPNIRTLYAFTYRNERGNEELVIAVTPLGAAPLVTADPDVIPLLKAIAQNVANEIEKPINLRRFTAGQLCETILPISDKIILAA